jgi:hypothetical protein
MSNPGLPNVRALTYAHIVQGYGLQADNYRQSDEHIALFIARIRERMNRYLYGPNRPAFLAPLSWILTFQLFAISTIWYISVSQVPIPLVDGPPDFSRGRRQFL